VSFPRSTSATQATPDETEEVDADDDELDVAEGAPEGQASTPEDITALKKQLKQAQDEAETNRRRFTGLQPIVQREVERSKQLAAQLQQYEQRMVEGQIASLPEEQQAAARMFYQMEQQQRQAQDQQRQQELVMTAVLKDTRMKELAQQHRVPQEDLGAFLEALDQGPASALEFFAKQQAKAVRGTRKVQRSASQADKFEGGGGGVNKPVTEPQTMDEATDAFKLALRQMAAARR